MQKDPLKYYSTCCILLHEMEQVHAAMALTKNQRLGSHQVILSGKPIPPWGAGYVQALGCCVCLCVKGMTLGSWLGTTRLERTALFGRAVVGYGGICALAMWQHEIFSRQVLW